jgi:uncharacterized protein
VHADVLLAVAGMLVGMLVGITGAGGGSLLTPVLVVLFGLPPAAAVSSDIVVSMVTRPLGAAIHLRRRTVHHGVVLWLAIGSVPAGFAGAVLDHLVGSGPGVQQALQTGIAVMLMIAAAGLGLRSVVMRRRQVVDLHPRQIAARPLPTVLLGAAGGLVFGMTSVGAGSLMMVSLLALYPSLPARSLVGTDLLQAAPLAAAAAVGHLLFGGVAMGTTFILIAGSVPGVLIGARISANIPSRWAYPAIAVTLALAGLRLGGPLLAAIVAPAALVVAAMLLTPRLAARLRGVRLSYGRIGQQRREEGEDVLGRARRPAVAAAGCGDQLHRSAAAGPGRDDEAAVASGGG